MSQLAYAVMHALDQDYTQFGAEVVDLVHDLKHSLQDMPTVINQLLRGSDDDDQLVNVMLLQFMVA